MITNLTHIEIEPGDNVTTIWLNKPETHNALDHKILHELIRVLNKLKQQTDDIVIIRGKGKTFCSGADLNRIINTGFPCKRKNKKLFRLIVRCFKTIRAYPMPVITAIHGNVHGGANGIIAASDIAVATDDASFSLRETRLGLAPTIVIPFLLTRCREHQIKNMIFQGNPITAVKAMETGLIDSICQASDMEKTLKQILDEIKRSVPEALKSCKLVFNKSNRKGINKNILCFSVKQLTRLSISKEAQKRIHDFLDKK